jgi:hypothetical protein
MERNGGQKPTREELLALRIQSVDPWKRGAIVVAGVVFAGLGLLLLLDNHPIWGVMVGLFGLITIPMGLIGRRRTVQFYLDSMDSSLAGAVISAIFEALN